MNFRNRNFDFYNLALHSTGRKITGGGGILDDREEGAEGSRDKNA